MNRYNYMLREQKLRRLNESAQNLKDLKIQKVIDNLYVGKNANGEPEYTMVTAPLYVYWCYTAGIDPYDPDLQDRLFDVVEEHFVDDILDYEDSDQAWVYRATKDKLANRRVDLNTIINTFIEVATKNGYDTDMMYEVPALIAIENGINVTDIEVQDIIEDKKNQEPELFLESCGYRKMHRLNENTTIKNNLDDYSFRIEEAFSELVDNDSELGTILEPIITAIKAYTEAVNTQFDNLYKLNDLQESRVYQKRRKLNEDNMYHSADFILRHIEQWITTDEIKETAKIYASHGVSLSNAVYIAEIALDNELNNPDHVSIDTLENIIFVTLAPLFKSAKLSEHDIVDIIFNDTPSGQFMLALLQEYCERNCIIIDEFEDEETESEEEQHQQDILLHYGREALNDYGYDDYDETPELRESIDLYDVWHKLQDRYGYEEGDVVDAEDLYSCLGDEYAIDGDEFEQKFGVTIK